VTRPDAGARLLHLGTVVADVVLGVPALPPRGGDVLASAATVTAGGGFNVLAAAARQGMPAAYGGAHGTGPLADLTRAALAAEGIAVLLPPVPGLDTGFVITLVEPGGERTFVTSPGAEARLAPAALAAVTARPQDTVYLSGYALAHKANRAALLGWLPSLPAAARLVFDPGPLGAQVRLDRQQLLAASVQRALHEGLARAQLGDLRLEAVDPGAVGRDLRREHALGALLATDLALDLLDLVAERRGGRAGMAGIGDQGRCTPHRERQRDARRERTEAHEDGPMVAKSRAAPSTGG